uniref:Uncharacterized protein n=1 Tax=Panagrellus redivivus TaxID=6233 RepID=A0A7E4VTZ0_PANRE
MTTTMTNIMTVVIIEADITMADTTMAAIMVVITMDIMEAITSSIMISTMAAITTNTIMDIIKPMQCSCFKHNLQCILSSLL